MLTSKILSPKYKDIVLLQIWALFICRIISGFTGFMTISYVEDVITILLFVCIMKKSQAGIKHPMSIFLLLFFLYWTMSFLFSPADGAYLYIYEIRAFFRFYIVLIASYNFLNRNDFENIMNIFDKIILVHFILSEMQIFVFHATSLDAVGGVLGTIYGYANIGSHMIMALSFIITLYRYLEKKESIRWSFLKIAMVLILSVQIEIKSFIFEAAVIVVLMFCYYGKLRIRTGLIILVAVIAVPMLATYYLTNFNYDIANIEGILEYLDSGYAGNLEAIGRTDGFEKILEKCFDNKVSLAIFGFGAGSVGTENLVYMTKGMNLEYFTYAKIFFNLGFIGIILFYTPFIVAIIKAIKMRAYNSGLGMVLFAVSVFCVYWTFYGNILESDIGGYLNYPLLAMAFVTRENIESEEGV